MRRRFGMRGFGGRGLGLLAVLTMLATTASAQMRVVTGDGLCPPGEAPMSLQQAQAQRDAVCRALGRWHIARLADGASIDGPGYQCQMRAGDARQLGHTVCVPAAAPPSMAVVPGVYDGVHPHWRDTVTLAPDGTYRRGNGDPGRWSVHGHTLVLAWQRWPAEHLDRQPDGSYRAPTNGFTLRLRPAAPLPPAMAVVPGVYDGVHPHWRDTVTLAPDGTYRRGNGDPGRWFVEGQTLVLAWQRWGPERLDLQPDGSYRAPTNGFTLRLRPAAPLPPAMVVTPGVYDGWHPHWQDIVTLAPDGTYRRGNGDPGRWFVEGQTLVLAWQRWGPERLDLQPDGSYRAPTNGFTLRLRPTGPVVAIPGPAIDPATLVGEWDARHPQWGAVLELLASSSLRRDGRPAGRWRVEGTQLVLTWRRGPETRFVLGADGTMRSADGVVLTRRVVVAPAPGPRVRVRVTR